MLLRNQTIFTDILQMGGQVLRRMSHHVDPAAIAEEARTVRLDAVLGPPRRSIPVGDSSTPESRTLTPLIMVRIQVPQPGSQVPLRDHVIEPKFVEKVRLLSILSSHHRRIILPSFNQQESSWLCHAASGLRSRWRFGSHGNEENQLSRLPLSARDHPAGDLALSPVQEKALAIENDIRGLLRNFGLKVGIVGVVGFEQRIHDLVEGVPELADIMEPLLAARRVLREKFAKLHRKVLLLARDNEVCQRLMTIPGVGPVVSLAFISTVDVPARFRNSKAVGPSLGLTPVLNQSGESHRVGRISLCGDEAMRALLYEAAQVMLTRVQKWSWLKAWAMNIAKRRGQKKAIVALARRLAVIMHRMWSDGTEFRWTREMAPTI